MYQNDTSFQYEDDTHLNEENELMKLDIDLFTSLKFDIQFLRDVIGNYHEYFHGEELREIINSWETEITAKEINVYNNTTLVRFVMEVGNEVVYCIYRKFDYKSGEWKASYIELTKKNHVAEIDVIFDTHY